VDTEKMRSKALNGSKIIGLMGALLLLSSSASLAQSGSGGSTGLAFLKFAAGSRASAMGEAFTAVADDAYATAWNPAGLNRMTTSQMVFTHTEWLADIRHEFIAFAFPAFGGGLGFSLITTNVGGIERRTTASESPLGDVDANDVALGISFAKRITPALEGGVTLKYLYEKIFVESSSGYAVDLGVNYRTEGAPFSVGLVVQNLGSMNELSAESIKLPTTVRVGVQYLLMTEPERTLRVAVDVVKTTDTDVHANVGAEFLFKQNIFLRAGYQSGFDHKSFSGGLGLIFHRYQLDYGFTPFDANFGDTHRFSLALNL